MNPDEKEMEMMSNAHYTETHSHTPTAGFPASETSSEHGVSGDAYFAQPYNLDAHGFYFRTFEDYERKAESLRDRYGNPVEEFEIQFIDGDDGALFDACGINQSNLSTWFDDIEGRDEHEKVALYFLTGVLGYALDAALDKMDDVMLFHGDAQEAAEELFDDCYAREIPDHLRCYFDIEKFARDLEIGGDFAEFDYDGATYTCTNASGI